LFGNAATDAAASPGDNSDGLAHRNYNCRSFFNVNVSRVSGGICTCCPDVTACTPAPVAAPAPAPMAAPLPPPAMAPIMAPNAVVPPTTFAVRDPRPLLASITPVVRTGYVRPSA